MSEKLKIRTNASKEDVRAIVESLQAMGWKWWSFGTTLEDPNSDDTEVLFSKKVVQSQQRRSK